MTLSTKDLLGAYANGFFPMAENREAEELYWFHPDMRGILPIEDFHVPKRLARTLRQKPFVLSFNRAFGQVMRECAKPRSRERDSWINAEILAMYQQLHEEGHAHSLECWREERLVGGIYGVSLGGAFFGESMFSRERDASKIALVALVELLKACGYILFDAQYVNPHLKQFGVQEIPREDYMKRLRKALQVSPNPSSRLVVSSGNIIATLSS